MGGVTGLGEGAVVSTQTWIPAENRPTNILWTPKPIARARVSWEMCGEGVETCIVGECQSLNSLWFLRLFLRLGTSWFSLNKCAFKQDTIFWWVWFSIFTIIHKYNQCWTVHIGWLNGVLSLSPPYRLYQDYPSTLYWNGSFSQSLYIPMWSLGLRQSSGFKPEPWQWRTVILPGPGGPWARPRTCLPPPLWQGYVHFG